MAAKVRRQLTVTEFLDWASNQERGRFELVDGVVVAMSPERARHVLTKAEAWLVLRNALIAKGLPCRAFSDGMTVVIDEHNSREPDAVVQCGEFDPDSMIVERPVVVVEVVSPSSGRTDLVVKLGDYAKVGSIMHYIVIDPLRRNVIHFSRRASGESFVATIMSSGDLTMADPGFSVAVDDLLGQPEA